MTTATPVRPRVDAPVPLAQDRMFPRLGPRTRRVVLITHLAATGVWLGMDVVLGALVATALAAPAADAAVIARTIAAFIGWPLVAAALTTLVSGVVLGLGSKYGLLRYWWVIVKLVLTMVLISLVLAVLVPSVAELVVATSAGVPADYEFDQQLIFPPVVSTSALLVAMTLSVIKPWGRR